MKRAFSLVELSIVLVILGLLVGGILAGRSLIRASELRASLVQIDNYRTATNSFKDKYMSWPGDFTLGYSVFAGGVDTNCGNNTSNSNGCNGDGDMVFTGVEAYRSWMHLTLAGLISEGLSFTTNYAIAGATWGRNAPASKLSGGYYMLSGASPLLHWVKVQGAGVLDSVLKPEDAWNIDTKTDDGVPSYGRVQGATGSNSTGNCAASATAYDLANSGIACRVEFQRIMPGS